MRVLLLINSNNANINSLDDCKNKTELFVFMMKLYIRQFNNIELYVKKCFPCTEMKSTFKKKTMNNFKKVDHIIFIDDTGLYRKSSTFIEYLRKYTKTISTFSKHSKFYNNEDNMFTYNNLTLNDNTYYIPPPIDNTIYTPIKEPNTIYILLNQKPNQFILDQLYNLISLNYQKNDIVFKIGIINTKKVDFINIKHNGDDVIYNLNNNIIFNVYIDYICEIAKANIFISSRSINDIYLLYELAMCNTLHVSKIGIVQHNIIEELDTCIFDESIEINWKEIFVKLSTYDIRQKLINNNHSWKNALTLIFNKLKQTKIISNKDINIEPIKTGYGLNIINKNRPNIMNLTQLHKKRADKQIKPKSIPKRKIILQSELLKH